MRFLGEKNHLSFSLILWEYYEGKAPLPNPVIKYDKVNLRERCNMKKGNVIHKFPGSNTPDGFYSFYRQGLEEMERVFVLKGGPGTGKSTLMRKIAYNLTERGYDVEMWQCSSDNDSIDGVIIPNLKIAVVDGTSPHTVDPVYPGAVDEIVNLGDHWNREILHENKEDIISLTGAISANFGAAYEELAEYKKQYDEYAENNSVGESRVTAFANDVIGEIFSDDLAQVSHFFASAITPKGWTGYNQELSENARKRFVLAGGTRYDIDLFLHQVEDAAVLRGHDIEIYHSTLAPECYEMLVLPNIGYALVDGAAPDLQPLPNDVLVELAAFDDSEHPWDEHLEIAVKSIANAKSLHNDLEEYYVKAMKFDEIDEVCKQVFAEIWQMVDESEK